VVTVSTPSSSLRRATCTRAGFAPRTSTRGNLGKHLRRNHGRAFAAVSGPSSSGQSNSLSFAAPYSKGGLHKRRVRYGACWLCGDDDGGDGVGD
jgi:hypothetical protein